jgi:acetolactate synthase-1/2/3 large subunit
VVDEGVVMGRVLFGALKEGHAHDWLQTTGGAIGDGPPLAVGAAIACPGRRVINFQADGSALYTVQALWTQAREKLDITTVILANRRYAVLQQELSRSHTDGRNDLQPLFDLGRPDLDWVAIASTTLAEF